MITHSDGEEVQEVTIKVDEAMRIRDAMREHRRLAKAMDWDYRKLDLQYENLIQSFNEEEQKEMYQRLMEELK
jgi:hypothetical protein